MEPTISDGEAVVVVWFRDSAEAAASVRHGDLVIYSWPEDTAQKWVKRVVGLPGDTLVMGAGVLVRNGNQVDEPYAARADSLTADPKPFIQAVLDGRLTPERANRNNWGPTVIPPGHYWVMGDGRDNSLDSRYRGFVPVAHIHGRANGLKRP